jgi:UDP-galactopyranose mutase
MTIATQHSRSAADALRDCSLPFLRHLQVTETEEEVVLSGRVGTYYYKQLAQEAVMSALNERRLRNLVVVE